MENWVGVEPTLLLKSGYRDEKNGYHLFTPCGCNPLSFRVSSLEPELDWQITYEY